MSNQLLLSRRQAASQLGLSVRSVDFLIKANKLPHIKLGSRVLVPADKLVEFAQSGHAERIRPK